MTAALPDGWRAVRLGDVADVLDARRIPLNADERAKIPGVYPYYGANGVVDNIDSWIFDEEVDLILLAEDGGHFDEFRTRPIAYRVSGKCWVNNHAHILKPKDLEASSFLFHSLVNKDIRPFINGTTRSKLTQADLRRIEVGLPPLPEQRAIAAVLDSIDEAIERTEEVIAATERLRDALLHELLTRGLPGHHTAWRDVPGLGAIPACWDVVRLGDVCAPPRYGAGASAQPFDPNLPRYVRITDITDDGRLKAEDARSAEPSKVEGYDLKPGDLLFARSGATVGKTYLYRPKDGPCVYAGYLIRFRAIAGVAVPEYLDRWTRSPFYRKWVASMLRAGAQPNINAAEYSSLPLALPPLPEQRAIATTLDSVDATIERARAERAALQSSKASTADALLTGRVRVPMD